MNSTIYIFGDFGYGCNQYPNDYTAEIFSQFHKRSQANTQLTIHRDDNMMYYGYVRKLHNREQYIGICIVLNGIMFRGVKTLFNRFENYITDIVVRGQIIEFSNDGNLISKVTKLYECQNEIERITKFIQNDIETLTTQKLPPTNLSIGKSESKSFVIDDKAESILEATYNYGYTYIYKDTGYNTDSLTSYSGKLQALNKEKNAALQTIEKQKQEIRRLENIQKNYKLVIWLILIICIGGIVGFSIINSRNATIQRLQTKVQEQEQTITSQIQTIDEHLATIESKNTKIQSLTNEIQELEHKRDSLITCNSELITENRSLTNDKSDLTKKLKLTESTLKEATAKISKKDTEISELKTQVNNYKNSNNKKQYEKYKTKNKTACYYRDNSYNYKKTGDSYYKGATITVYDTNYKYALTEKGYVLLSDLQKVY